MVVIAMRRMMMIMNRPMTRARRVVGWIPMSMIVVARCHAL
jgi:hypothetical protein